jgi:excisionase family DNA binding protein
MTLAEAAAYLRVSEADIQALLDSGEVKSKKVGSQVRIAKKALDAYLSD